MKAVFLDRDGTINVGIPKYERIDSLEKVELIPGVLDALSKLAALDYGVFFITNQAGIAEGLIDLAEFDVINKKVLELIAPSGINILKTYLCPHGEGSTCGCRKPKPKMILDAAREFGIDLGSSYMVGDRSSDVMTGVNAGVKSILVLSGDLSAASSEQAIYTAPTLLDAIKYIANH